MLPLLYIQLQIMQIISDESIQRYQDLKKIYRQEK